MTMERTPPRGSMTSWADRLSGVGWAAARERVVAERQARASGRPARTPMIDFWQSVGSRWLPFADAASAELPLGRLLRLTLFQVSVGMAVVLLTGTLNRVMIVELGVPTAFVALVIALPLLIAPVRVLMGHRSDTYRSLLGWKRVPYMWLGTLIKFGGFAILPFALLLLQSRTYGPEWVGPLAAGLAVLMVGFGLHTVQTAGLALASDLAPADKRPRVVALAYVMLLLGMGGAALAYGWLLTDFSALALIQVVQGTAVATILINVVALWKQEPRRPGSTDPERVTHTFREAWSRYGSDPFAVRLLVAVALGSAAFSMQDVLLEPYGAEVLGLTVAQTTRLTALFAAGTLVGLAIAARRLGAGGDPVRLAAMGVLAGVLAFSCVIFAAPIESPTLFRTGTALISFGGGLFAVGTLTLAMNAADEASTGLALGAWGAVQAASVGAALFAGGALRDVIAAVADTGTLGAAFMRADIGYSVVYHVEIALLFASLAVLGPLVGRVRDGSTGTLALAEMPG